MSNVVKEKPSVDSEFRVPILERLQNAENSLDSKDDSTMLNLDSKENDKGTSCNSNVKSAHSAVCSSSHQGNNQATTSFTDSSSVTEKSICRSVVKDHAAETSLMDCDETFHSTNEEFESSYYSCGGSVMDSTNNDFIESIDIDAGKGEVPDTDLNEGSFFEETGLHSHSRKGSRPKDLNDKGESSTCKDLKEGDQEDDVLIDCAISKAPARSSTPFESKTKGVNKDEYNSFDDLEERRQSSISDDADSDQINKPDVYFSEIANNTVSPAESGAIACKEADQNSSCDELKEDSDNKDSDQINNHDKNFHEDSNDGTYPNGSDSSDEDLLTPPRFLYEKTKLKPDIRTPEKGIAPIYATPSPTAKEVVDEKTIKYKLSFEKLIAEKAKHRERDAELAKMEAELQQGIENGGIGQMQVPSSFSDIESEEELTDGKVKLNWSG